MTLPSPAAAWASDAALAGEEVLLAALAERLQCLSFFASFDALAFAELLSLARWRDFVAGESLQRAGESGDSFSVLLAGQARVYRAGRLIGELMAGDCCGEMAWLRPDGAPRAADVIALSDGTRLEIPVAVLAAASCHLRLLIERAFVGLLLDRLEQADRGFASVML